LSQEFVILVAGISKFMNKDAYIFDWKHISLLHMF